jgi:thiamine pyrophosphokinase
VSRSADSDGTAPRRALIVLGGNDISAGSDIAAGGAAVIPAHDVVIAADSGVDQAHRLGVRVDLAIGDFDSVSADGLERAERQGAQIQRHPVAKSATDFELALQAALELGVCEAAVIGGGGGRLDHLLANALVMASPSYQAIDLVAYDAGARLHVVRRLCQLHGEPGETVTLLAVNGPATGVTTSGLLYPLTDDRLDPGSSRGVSNQLTAAEAEVRVGSGVLLAILPGPPHRLAPTTDDRPEGTTP